MNYNDPTGEIMVAPGGGGGGVISLPITFIVWGFGKIFGWGTLKNPTVELWRKDPGRQVASWDANIANAEQRAKDDEAAMYIKGLKVIDDCYQRGGWFSALRRR